MHITKYIPNTITCLNLSSGCFATVSALQGNLGAAIAWIIIAAIFDFSDGLAARLLKAYSPLGKELDSLSDIVSFGVAPGMSLYVLLEAAASSLGCGGIQWLAYLAFAIPVFSGLRLAKFNIDDRQTTSFIGMPVPAHALLWGSLSYALQPLIASNALCILVACLAASLLTSYLLVSEIPMFSMKVKTLKWKGNELRYLLVCCGILFIVLFGFLGIAGSILLYISLSLINNNLKTK